MSETKTLMEHYKQIRNRLRNPPNAVPDTEINLLKTKLQPLFQPSKRTLQPPTKTPKRITPRPQIIPFKRQDITFSTVLKMAAEEFMVTYQELKSHKTRKLKYVLPRQIAVYLANKHLGRSLASLGWYLDMDHTTMIYARDKIKHLITIDDTILYHVQTIEEKLLANLHRSTFPALSKPYLGSQKEQQDGNKGSNEITSVSAMDS